MLAYSVSLTQELGARGTVIVAGHQGDAVRAAFADHPEIRFAEQAKPLGTGDAVRSAEKALPKKGVVLILTGDTPLLQAGTLRSFLDQHVETRAAITVLAADYPDPTGYGRVIVDANGSVERIVEHKDAGLGERSITLCNTGIYACDLATLFKLLPDIQPHNAQGEYYLTDIIGLARAADISVGYFRAHSHHEFLGINDRVQLAEAEAILQARIVTRWQRAGVTIHLPQTVYIEPEVRIDPDVVIEGQVYLAGQTVIESNCVLETGCRVEHSHIGAGTRVKAYSVLEQSKVGPGCILGPFAHLRPDTTLEAGVHIGNFVETKKTHIAQGSKANHLSYLGDAEIGSGVNIGAGTITCNYDGVNKHKTTIEDGAFIGSDTQLVAPVTVGKEAVIGAGTTVTENIPAGALAVSRTPQKNIAGYRQRKSKKTVST